MKRRRKIEPPIERQPTPKWLLDEARSDKVQWFFGSSKVPGVMTLEATVPTFGAPVCIVWYRFVGAGSTLDVVGLYVEQRLRRCGLARRSLEQLYKSYECKMRLVTGSLSEDGEKLWRAMHGRRRGDWFVLFDLKRQTKK